MEGWQGPPTQAGTPLLHAPWPTIHPPQGHQRDNQLHPQLYRDGALPASDWQRSLWVDNQGAAAAAAWPSLAHGRLLGLAALRYICLVPMPAADTALKGPEALSYYPTLTLLCVQSLSIEAYDRGVGDLADLGESMRVAPHEASCAALTGPCPQPHAQSTALLCCRCCCTRKGVSGRPACQASPSAGLLTPLHLHS